MECKCASCAPETGEPAFTFPADTPQWWRDFWIYPGQPGPLKPLFLVVDSGSKFTLMPIKHDNADYLEFLAHPLKLRQESKSDTQTEQSILDYWWHREPIKPAPWPDTSDQDLHILCWACASGGLKISAALDRLAIPRGNRTAFSRVLKAYQAHGLLPYKSR